MSKITQILPNLESLSAKELKIIRAEVDRLLCVTSKTDIQLYQAIQWVLGIDLPLSQFEKTSTYKQWVKNQPIMDEFIETVCKGIKSKLERGDRLKVKVFLVQLIKDYLTEIGVPKSINSIVGQLGNIKTIFDKSYPNYIHCGIGKIAILAALGKYQGGNND